MSCERDDLCPPDTPTTPQLIIDFLDSTDSESPKNVANLVVKGIGNETILEGYAAVTSASVVLPLKTTADQTQFRLYQNGVIDDNGVVSGNDDLITINYTREEVYVSRACGYKTIFKNVTIQLDMTDSDRWIQVIAPVNTNDNQSVEDETATHFNISH